MHEPNRTNGATSATMDLNSDVGEGFGRWELGDDAAVLATVTSANVACGFHAGDPTTMATTVRTALENDIAIGAHVSYRDLAGFGRRYVDADEAELSGDVIYQIGALAGIARSLGARISYVKPHGALYNTIASGDDRGRRHARAVLAAVTRYDPSLPVVGLAGSAFLDSVREAGLPVVAEAFADRAYTAAGTLVSRREPGSVLHDADLVAQRMVRLVRDGTVEAVDGSTVEVEAQSICVHGDSPGAVSMAQAVRTALEEAGVVLRAFAAGPRAARAG
jgi:UPF0271 protein